VEETLVIDVDELCDQVARPATATATADVPAAPAPSPAPLQCPSPMQQLASNLTALCAARASPIDVAHGEYALLSYLPNYHVPLTLAEIEAIVPSLQGFSGILNKVCTNIGRFYHAHTGASETELEKILVHIVANHDALLDHTKAQLERFKLE